jgi:PKHD-type hydroxylase|tara:strand:+ start:68 stop:658 length:591 start_codon:yes stop_codon:yes gene_type:complete
MFKSYNFNAKENDPQNYYYFDKGFNSDELSKIENNVVNLDFTDGSVDGSDLKENIRKSRIKWIPQNNDWEWLYSKLANMITQANDDLWRFNITQIPEQIQYTEYWADVKGKYDWHQDIGLGEASKRKISVTVQLSDTSDYEGGDLEMWKGSDNFVTANRGKGNVFIFPSYMVHRVKPVTKGIRKSFVLWVGGHHYI